MSTTAKEIMMRQQEATAKLNKAADGILEPLAEKTGELLRKKMMKANRLNRAMALIRHMHRGSLSFKSGLMLRPSAYALIVNAGDGFWSRAEEP